MNLGSHLLNLKSTLIRVNTNQGPDMYHLPQGRISPLQPDTGFLSPLGLSPQGLFLIKTSLNMIQTPLIIGKYLCLTFPHSTLKRSTLLGAFFPSLTPGSLCLGPQLQSWVWTMRKAVKSSDLEVLPLFFHLAQLSRTPLINFNMTLRLLIYPRVNTSSLLHPLLSGTGWDSPVIRTNIRS